MPFPEKIRGSQMRQFLVDNYELKCTGHFDIFDDEDGLRCCCGDPLGEEYFRFVAAPKNDSKEAETVFYAGPSCGPRINRLAAITAPEKICLYVADAPRCGRNSDSVANPNIVLPIPINIEIKQVCFLIQKLMKNNFRKFLDDLLERANKYPNWIPTDRQIIVLNEIAGEQAAKIHNQHGDPCVTLREAIIARAAKSGRKERARRQLRIFHFSNLETKLAKINDGLESMF